jgi:hypothetical protein
MAKKKRKRIKNPAWKANRKGVSNVNQKGGPMKDKRTKRNRTRQAQEDSATKESQDS